MLSKRHRLNRGEDFRRVLSGGKKHRTPLGLVAVTPSPVGVTRFGFVVSKAVGNAVVRNLVKRRLRAAAMSLLDLSPPVDVVVRSRPGSDRVSVEQNRQVLIDAVGQSR